MKNKLDYGPFVKERIDEWAYWINERERIRVSKAKGRVPPWSKDPVLTLNRYCNVRRMDDKVSIWMLENWFNTKAVRTDPRTALIAGLLARMINRVATLEALGSPFKAFDYEKFRKAMYAIKATGVPVFTNAYIINGASGGPKIEQVLLAIQDCDKQMLRDKNAWRFIDLSSMQKSAEAISTLRGVGPFISGQVVADLRHVLGNVDKGHWADRMNWAPPGPGSSRGMKYLLGLAPADEMAGRGSDLPAKQFLPALRQLVALAQVHPVVGPIFEERELEAHDIQNTLCETSKFIRIKYGVGRAKNGYDAHAAYQRELDI